MFRDRLLEPQRETQVEPQVFDRAFVKTDGRVGKKAVGLAIGNSHLMDDVAIIPAEAAPMFES